MTKSADMATLLDSSSKIPGTDIAGTSLPVASINASGTPSASTFLRGDGSWQSPAGGVTSLAAGNGITVSGSTGAVTVSQDVYTGTSAGNTSYPVGTVVAAYSGTGCWNSTWSLAQSKTLYVLNSGTYGINAYSPGGGWSALTGTWRLRGLLGQTDGYFLFQRTA
jgi:hypothetical protein